MTGGLSQIAVYGTQDIFLTGSPQITFFKIVYRRYTNFAIESIKQEFSGLSNFGTEVFCNVDKLGDLMHKVYLEIELPMVDLLKSAEYWNTSLTTSLTQYQSIQQYYQMVYNYISLNTTQLRNLIILLDTNNTTMANIENTVASSSFSSSLIATKSQLYDYINTNLTFASIVELVNLRNDLLQQLNRIDCLIIFNSVISNINDNGVNNTVQQNDLLKRNEIRRIIENIIYPEIEDFYMKAYNLYIQKQTTYLNLYNNTYNERYKFAWVEEIGHAIIDTIEINIGNQAIDRHTGDWLILFNKLIKEQHQESNYNELIGNIPNLYNFNDTVKPNFKLRIPLQFWFNRHNGLALPLIALRYHDVIFKLKYKSLNSLCYVEDTDQLLDIPNIQTLYNINIISSEIYIDYIFLDSDERKRFAQSTHEYLIEIVQSTEIDNIYTKTFNAHTSFSHPTKFVIWFFQPSSYRSNPTGRNKCQWNNFGINNDKTGNPIDTAYLQLNSNEITIKNIDVKYFNYVQPYMRSTHSPTDGINFYSFSLDPFKHQPSGTCNLSRIDDFSINNTFTNDFENIMLNSGNNDFENNIYMGIYVFSNNIIRIMNGMLGLAFQTSL